MTQNLHQSNTQTLKHCKAIKSHEVSTKDLRIFLAIWTGIFMLIAIFPLFRDPHTTPRLWAIIACIVSIVLICIPRVIVPFYRLWILLGETIGFVISRTILAILFFGIFTPIALFFRLIKRDVLHQKPDKTIQSYFLQRTQQPQSMKNQF
ncbi:SxtJ family membrane protein [Helicobacter equorum]|uniref:SxtJ family membrane protein n=1 Tax=Helicobacter equorum TaxID=361872 RepID=UPI000CF0DC23|nr:SxtJ family membrane protein [Helicobacter equorum]